MKKRTRRSMPTLFYTFLVFLKKNQLPKETKIQWRKIMSKYSIEARASWEHVKNDMTVISRPRALQSSLEVQIEAGQLNVDWAGGDDLCRPLIWGRRWCKGVRVVWLHTQTWERERDVTDGVEVPKLLVGTTVEGQLSHIEESGEGNFDKKMAIGLISYCNRCNLKNMWK